ncbi:MAG: hypothetical protein MJY84_07255 [Bacteroidales bacterium]|nr:hypothetical protein [Bacteroidales bacterium]
MKILVESGATKSDWRIIEGDRQTGQFLCSGMNVSSMNMETITSTLSEGLSKAGCKTLEGFYLYAAGVVSDEIRRTLTDFVSGKVQVGEIEIQNDLLGAARSVCGHGKGIVAILGTGSNTCFYDGETISQKVMAGGFILGDDGSGAVLGRMFLADYLKGLVPEPLKSDFESHFDSSYAGIVANVYRSDSPSGYLGRIAPLVVSHYDEPYAKELVDRNFRNFIERSLLRYDTSLYPVGVVGGFGTANKDKFSRLCEEAGIKVGRYVMAPVEGLVEYHCGRI